MDENKELVETMEDYAEELEASFKRLHEGDIVTGTVVAVTDDQVLVDLKYFAQGVIDRENLSNDPDFNMKEEIQPGDLLTATVIQTDDGEGNVVLGIVRFQTGGQAYGERILYRSDRGQGKVLRERNCLQEDRRRISGRIPGQNRTGIGGRDTSSGIEQTIKAGL